LYPAGEESGIPAVDWLEISPFDNQSQSNSENCVFSFEPFFADSEALGLKNGEALAGTSVERFRTFAAITGSHRACFCVLFDKVRIIRRLGRLASLRVKSVSQKKPKKSF
jgi:hypothetical protein